MRPRKLLMLELNEITWDLVDPLIHAGRLPNFERLKARGTWGTPVSVDRPPQLDPWITWTTLYTGRPQAEHNVYFLQQPPETIKARRVWEYCADAGRSVGIYGSVCSWPPRSVQGFYVPDTFAPDASTYPENLSPIQTLNLTYTRSVRLPSDQDSVAFKLRLGTQLIRLGLDLPTAWRITRQLATEWRDSRARWKRVALQPQVNFAFFRRLYRQHRPDFATFHSNHVAHYMHTYWQAMDPERFLPLETPREEVEVFGEAIEHGYVVADELVGRMLELADDDTVLVVASSMGQKPYRSPLKSGKEIAQWRVPDRLLEILGVRGGAKTVATMSGEILIHVDEATVRDRIAAMIGEAYIDTPEQPAFFCEAIDGALRVNLRFYERGTTQADSRVHFPSAPGSPAHPYDDVIHSTGHLKSGCHDERGLILFHGPGIAPGVELGACDNLNIAPTLLSILGLPIPREIAAPPLPEIVADASLARSFAATA